MATKWTLASRVANRIKDLPSALGSATIAEYIEDAAQSVQSFTGNGIDLTDIGSAYHPVLTDMATMYCLQYMANVGVSYSLGRTRIEKRTEIDGINRQITILESRVNKEMNSLGTKISQSVLNLRDTQLE